MPRTRTGARTPEQEYLLENLLTIFRGLPLALGVSRLSDGRFVKVNDAFLKLYGYRRSEVLGRTSAELGMWPRPEERAAMIKAVLRDGSVIGRVVEYQPRRGPPGHIQVSTQIRRLGSERYLIGILQDVTERRRLEAALHQERQRLDVVLASSRQLVFSQDLRLRYTWVANPVLGATVGDVIGKTDAQLLGADGARELTAIKRRVLATGETFRGDVCVARNGMEGWYENVLAVQRDANGAIVGLLGSALDITERRRVQRELQLAHAQARRLASRLRDHIEDERRELSRDIHDHVGAMLTGARMKLAALSRRIPDPQRWQAEFAALDALVADTTQATREICARLRPPSLEDVGLAKTCRWYLGEWSTTTGIAVRGSFPRRGPEPPIELSIDVFRVLQELLSNVARHAGATRVGVVVSFSQRGINLAVRDDGGGIRDTAGENGIGLLGVRERAARHGGSMEIDTGKKGTAVTVKFLYPSVHAHAPTHRG